MVGLMVKTVNNLRVSKGFLGVKAVHKVFSGVNTINDRVFKGFLNGFSRVQTINNHSYRRILG